jgi:hypothetical protein
MDTLLTVAQATLAVIGGAVVALHVIAPMTKTTRDDQVLTWLQWLELQLRKLLPAPSPAVAVVEAEKLEA